MPLVCSRQLNQILKAQQLIPNIAYGLFRAQTCHLIMGCRILAGVIVQKEGGTGSMTGASSLVILGGGAAGTAAPVKAAVGSSQGIL